MSGVVLILGLISFKDFEVSAGVRFGGTQRLAVHQLNGGGRVIDTLGRNDADIQFEGIFTGSDATLRARALDELRSAGLSIPLTWDVYFYSVIIREFNADYRNSWWIPYTIRCTVVQDEAAAVVEQALSLAATLATDAGTAVAEAAGAGTTLSFASITTPTSQELTTAQAQISAAISNAESGWDPNALDTVGSASAGVAAIGSAASATGQLAQLSVASGYVGRAVMNVSIPTLAV